MKELLKRFWYEEDGMGTIEIVIIIAVLVAVALIFKTYLQKFLKDLTDKFFDADKTELPADNAQPPT